MSFNDRGESSPSWTAFSKNAPDSPTVEKGTSDEWNTLAAQVGAKKTPSIPAVIRWIYENAGTEPSSIDPQNIPSMGALRHLQHVQQSDKNYEEFLTTMYAKMIPNKEDIRKGERANDDNSHIMRMLDNFDAELERGRQDNPGGEEAA